ncbi:MAG TPA: ASCH domain-containing protein [Abditibacteriaceae bacterium]|jgi:hypothetical protein
MKNSYGNEHAGQALRQLKMDLPSVEVAQFQPQDGVSLGYTRAISLWDPWATLVAIGAKKIETRSWPTDYRGPLAIHASRRTSELKICLQNEHFWKALSPRYVEIGEYTERGKAKLAHHFSLGCVVAVVDLKDCVPTEELASTISDQELAFGNYARGRFAWILENVRSLQNPLPQRGAQRFFNVDLTDVALKEALS